MSDHKRDLMPAAWVSAFAVAWAVFQIWVAFFGPVDNLILRPVHVFWAAALTFLLRPGFRKTPNPRIGWDDVALALLSIAVGVYMLSQHTRLIERTAYVDSVEPADYVVGVLAVLLVLEGSRRLVGISLSLVAVGFIIYAFAGQYMPGIFAHRGITFAHFIELEILSNPPDGMFGMITGVSAEMVFYFIMFGAFLDRSGGGRLFTDFAYAMTGRARGGPAKAAIVSSSLFGTISGSAVGNVLITGTFTIPLMKRTGFPGHVAGAIEAVASTGGQLMPPVMGAAAFIMAQVMGAPYKDVVVAAALPAVLFYVSLFISVDRESRKRGMKGDPQAASPEIWKGILKRLHLIIPLGYLVYLIFSGYSLGTVGIRATVAVAIVSLLSAATRMGPKDWWQALETTAKQSIVIAVPSAVAGSVVGLIVFTGLGLKLTTLLVDWSATSLLIALLFVAIACLIMGMGMPTAAAYLMVAVLMAPALIELGISTMAAHMFVFYFAILSMVTPPVGMAAYAAGGVAKANLWSTGLTGFRLSLVAFIVPFAFVTNEALLFNGTWGEILWVTVSAGLGTLGLAGVVTGYWRRSLKWFERILLGVAAVLLISPELRSDAIGLVILIGVWGLQYLLAGPPTLAAEPVTTGSTDEDSR